MSGRRNSPNPTAELRLFFATVITLLLYAMSKAMIHDNLKTRQFKNLIRVMTPLLSLSVVRNEREVTDYKSRVFVLHEYSEMFYERSSKVLRTAFTNQLSQYENNDVSKY